MAERMSYKQITEVAQTLGLHVATWAPGDGVRRIRFFAKPVNNYFADYGVFTALGTGEAAVFLRGVQVGRDLATDK